MLRTSSKGIDEKQGAVLSSLSAITVTRNIPSTSDRCAKYTTVARYGTSQDEQECCGWLLCLVFIDGRALHGHEMSFRLGWLSPVWPAILCAHMTFEE